MKSFTPIFAALPASCLLVGNLLTVSAVTKARLMACASFTGTGADGGFSHASRD